MRNPLSEFDLLAEDAPSRLKGAFDETQAQGKELYKALKAVLSEEQLETLKALLDLRYHRGVYFGARHGIFAERERHLRAQRTAAPEEPAPGTPGWDYRPNPDAQGPSAEERDRLGVEAAARTVEEYVTRVGPVSKGEVSHAFPHLARLLPAAYRHLREARRIEVRGNALRPPGGQGG